MILPPRALEAIRWVAEGKTNWEAAAIMGITGRGVAKHIDRVCDKLNAVNRTHAVALAFRLGLIQ